MDKFKQWLKTTWEKIRTAYVEKAWLKWATLGVAVVLILAIVLPIALTSGKNDKKPDNSSSVETSSTIESSSIADSSEESSSAPDSSEAPHVHDYSQVVTMKQVSCEEDGAEMKICSCGKDYILSVIPKLGHNYLEIEEKDPGCTTVGYTAYKECQNCGDRESEPQEIAATGHNYENGECTVCHNKEAIKGLKYEPFNGGLMVIGLEEGVTDTEIVIADEHEGKSVKRIAKGAFKDNKTITSVTISVSEIGEGAFSGCTALKDIQILDTVTNIEEDAFANTAYFKNSSNWQNGALYMGKHLINASASTGAYVIKEGTAYVSDSAFYMANAMTSLTIPASVVRIGNQVFNHCTKLVSISVDEANRNYKSIDGNLYSKDGKTLILYAIGKTETTFNIPEGVEIIGDYAFCDYIADNKQADALTTIVIPTTVKKIGQQAFSSRDSLTSIIIPASIEEIGVAAFAFCTSLESVQFMVTEGWIATNVNDGLTAAEFKGTDLQNMQTAANYLTDRETYAYKIWKRIA